MKDTLQPGIEHTFTYLVPPNKTVPALYPEAEEFQVMPNVFATGFLVGFIEWACILALKPYLDWPSEQTVGTRIDVSHTAPTPPGVEVSATVRLVEVNGKQLLFEVEARDPAGIIGAGTHERFVIDARKFNGKLQQKIEALQG